MASLTTARNLYTDTCKLAYAETDAARKPRSPMAIADRTELLTQASRVADTARELREVDPKSIPASKLNAAVEAVSGAESMFLSIYHSQTTTLTKDDVIQATEAAIQAVQGCL